MSEQSTVRCGCTRTMTLDAARGRGAYRCGCGARVVIAMPASTVRCVGTHRGGPCRQSIEVSEPLPLCPDHFTSTGLRTYVSWWKRPEGELARLITAERRRIELADQPNGQEIIDYAEQCIREEEQRLAEQRTEAGRIAARAKAERGQEDQGVVYFIRSGDEVKIGKTIDIHQRLTAIRALTLSDTELLATEPGYTRRERALHDRFATYRTHHEWFALKPKLVTYINGLREAAGMPSVKARRPLVDKVKSTL